jgi:MFS family permease
VHRLTLPPGLAPLSVRNYALFFLGFAASHAGSMLESTAIAWVLYQLTDSPFLLGLAGLFRAVPFVILAPFGGAIADRFSRHTILLVTQTTLGLGTFGLGLLVLSGAVQPWHLYAYSALSAVVYSFDNPARHSLFPTLVPRDLVRDAVSLNSMAARGAALVGPAISGILIARGGNALPFFVNAVSFGVLVVALVAMRLDRAQAGEADHHGPLGRRVLEGLAFVGRNPLLLSLLVAETLVSIFGHNNTLLTVFARDVLDAGAEGLGLLRSSIAAGALLGLWMMVFVRRVGAAGQGMLVVVAGLTYTASLAGFAFSRWLPLSILLMVVLGLSDAIWGVVRNSAAQLGAPEAMRGRVMSLFIVSTRGFTPLADIQAGSLISALGPTGGGVVGAGVIFSALLALIVRRTGTQPGLAGSVKSTR